MIKIGDFSKLSALSVRVLRHYDQIDLLKPEYIDPDSGYRYYKPHQLHTSHQIKSLRGLGISLPMIKEMLGDENDSDSLRTHLRIQKDALKQDIDAIHLRLNLLDSMLVQLERDDTDMEYTVNIKEIPARKVMSVRKKIESYQHEGALWTLLMQETGPQNIAFASPVYALAKFHDTEYREVDVDVEVQMSVVELGEDTENVKFYLAPSENVASIMMKGSYDAMPKVSESIATWMSQSEYEFDGPMFNINIISPNEDPNPESWLTEVCYPIKHK